MNSPWYISIEHYYHPCKPGAACKRGALICDKRSSDSSATSSGESVGAGITSSKVPKHKAPAHSVDQKFENTGQKGPGQGFQRAPRRPKLELELFGHAFNDHLHDTIKKCGHPLRLVYEVRALNRPDGVYEVQALNEPDEKILSMKPVELQIEEG